MKVVINAKIDSDLKTFLQNSHFSESLTSFYIRNLQFILKNNKPLTNYSIAKNDIIEITLKDEESTINIIDKPLDIIYEDDYLLIIYKPHNLALIGTKRHYEHHLSGMIMNYYQKINLKSTVHFVNRLDYQTAGLVVVAKHQYIHALMSKSKILKRYLLKCFNAPKDSHGYINLPISKDKNHPIKRMVSDDGKYSSTEYQLLFTNMIQSDVLVTLHTGRTHQIRVHFAAIGCPLIGDSLYGLEEPNQILQLESSYLSFQHPLFNNSLLFTSNNYKIYEQKHKSY